MKLKARELFDMEAYYDKQHQEWGFMTNETPFDKWLCIKMARMERQIAAFTLTNSEFSKLMSENDVLRQVVRVINPHIAINENDIVCIDDKPLDVNTFKKQFENTTDLEGRIKILESLLESEQTILKLRTNERNTLRKALEDIQYMIDPMGSTGNDTIYNIALNALKK